MPVPFRLSVRSRPVVPWELLSSSLARTPRASRRSLLLEGVVLGSLVQTAAGHDLPDARERSIRTYSSEIEWRWERPGVVRSPEVLSVAGHRRRMRLHRHQPTRILSIAATRKMRPKINAGNVI